MDKGVTERGAMASDPDMLAIGIEAAVRANDPEKLGDYLTTASASDGMAKHPLYNAITARGIGVAKKLSGNNAEAANFLHSALADFQELDTSWQIGRTLLELGEVERSLGNADQAREHFSDAVSAFESLGANPDTERARAGLELMK